MTHAASFRVTSQRVETMANHARSVLIHPCSVGRVGGEREKNAGCWIWE
jgi:hypothetical protein